MASEGDPAAAAAGQTMLPKELLEKLCEIGTARTFPKNAIVVVEGEPAETLYIVLSGRLRVYVADEEGREAELNQMGPGEYFGELMLGSTVRTASVRTMETSRLCLIGRHDFETFIRSSPETTFHLIQTLIHRIKVLTGNVQSLALMDVYGRVSRLFAEELVEEDGRRFVPGMSQQRIGERVGASRSMINRILKDLTTGGYIEVTRERIELLRELPRRW
jgi:CRP/FNR family cyclic AMP-dependent transcriptional regulator